MQGDCMEIAAVSHLPAERARIRDISERSLVLWKEAPGSVS